MVDFIGDCYKCNEYIEMPSFSFYIKEYSKTEVKSLDNMIFEDSLKEKIVNAILDDEIEYFGYGEYCPSCAVSLD